MRVVPEYIVRVVWTDGDATDSMAMPKRHAVAHAAAAGKSPLVVSARMITRFRDARLPPQRATSRPG